MSRPRNRGCERTAILSEIRGQRLCQPRCHEDEGDDHVGRSRTTPVVSCSPRASSASPNRPALVLSGRQVRRLIERSRAYSGAALVHANRGRRPANRVDERTRGRIVELATGEFAGFNPVHLAECLAEQEEPIEVCPRTIRRILGQAGVRNAHPPPQGGSRSARADSGRRHAAPGRRLGRSLARGARAETDPRGRHRRHLQRRHRRLLRYAHRDRPPLWPAPWALYTDRHSMFAKRSNRPAPLTEQLRGQRSLTQVAPRARRGRHRLDRRELS